MGLDMSAAIEKSRRIEAEKQASIAQRALQKIAHGHSRNPERDAADALDEMFRHGPKQPLQGLVGGVSHDR